MKYNIINPITMTIITIGSLKTAEERTELLKGDIWLWFVLIIFVTSWIRFFIQKNKEKKEKN